MNNQRDLHFCALSRPKAAKWLKFEPATGRPVPSRFGGGSYDALGHRPISLRRPDSFYSKLLLVLDEIRASGNAWRSGETITKLYNDRYSEKRRTDTVTKVLSRFHTWHLVSYKERPDDKRGGLWALRGDIDLSDVDDLLLRAESQEQITGKRGYEK